MNEVVTVVDILQALLDDLYINIPIGLLDFNELVI